jgi:cyclic pyranopterin phosphate synthase
LSNVEIDFEMNGGAVRATCSARTTAQTGVEMEALAGVAIALLTIYDMCKAIDNEMEISNVRLVKKEKRAI